MPEDTQIKSVPELLKLQQELRERFESRLGTLRSPRTPTAEEAIEFRNTDLAHAQAVLAEAESQREAIVKHWDERIQRLRARVDRVTQEIKAAKETLKISKTKAKAAAKKK
jgi:hypothetical protein